MHYFSYKYRNRGYEKFVPIDALTDKNGFLDHGNITVIFSIEPIQTAEPKKSISRQETGFIGLENQGATCYMNSLLQTLFNTPLFRWVCSNQ